MVIKDYEKFRYEKFRYEKFRNTNAVRYESI